MNLPVRFSFRPLLAAVVLAGSACLPLSLAMAQDSVTLDFPKANHSLVLPAGLAAWPIESFSGLSTIQIPLLRLNEEGSLIVTVIFQDQEDRVVSAKWRSTLGRDTILSNNLSEGIRGWNQRALLVPYELLSEAGSLVFESDAEVQPVKRVNLAWTWRTEVFVGTAGQKVEVIQDPRRVLTKQDLEDRAVGPTPDAWAKGIWKAFLQEGSEPLDEPLGFSFEMEGPPQAAVLRAKVLGVPLTTTPDVWVNGTKVGPVTVQIPDLATEGFIQSTSGVLSYAGWREAAVSIPAAYLTKGVNEIIWGGIAGAYVKDSYLELNFGKEGAPFVVPEEPAIISFPAPPAAPVYPDPVPWNSSSSESLDPGPAVIFAPPSNL